MTSLHEVAVIVVSLAVGDENQKAFHNFAFYYDLWGVPVGFVPDEFRYPLQKFEMWQVRIERARWVFLFGLLRQLSHRYLVVADNQAQKFVNAAQVDLDALVNVATSGFYLKRLADWTLFNTIVLKIERLVLFLAALLNAGLLLKRRELILAVPSLVD